MTTLAGAGIFRIHDIDRPAAGASAGLPGIFRQLAQEWTRLCALPSTRHTLRRWAAAEGIFDGIETLGDLVDHIDAGGKAQTDRLLLALVRLAQDGHQLAARVVLQAMLPKLARMTRTTRPSSSDDRAAGDRANIAVAAFWDVIYSYPVDRRPTRVAANLALDTLHQSPSDLRKTHSEPMDPEVVDRLLAQAPESGPTPEAELTEVIAWALDVKAITAAEAAVLVRVYLPAVGELTGVDLAQSLGISHAALRQRASRASRHLIAAVQGATEPILGELSGAH